MDLVLGLSMTSRAVRWVLVEGTTGEGDTIDRGAFDPVTAVDPDELLDVLLVNDVGDRIHAIGVTWTNEADDAASGILRALTARGYNDVIAVSELEAGDELAAGIAAIAEYENVAVCIVEPDAAVVALVDAGEVTVDRIGRPLDGADVVELPSAVIAALELDDRQPEAIFVLGSADDLELIVSTIDDATESPVISAADAGLALARGAALASARAVNSLAPARLHLPSRTGALTSILVASVVIFVISLSVAVGLGFPSGPNHEQPQATNAVEAPAPAPSPATQAAKKARLTESLREARPLVAQTMVVAAPPPPEAAPPAEPAYQPPAAVPAAPPPAYVPPAPAYVPPVPQPRLRDRIIERIPIINRFHEPDYPYPQ
jgi:hypothetical protein